MPTVYCLCLTMECSLSTGKHNAKKCQQPVIQERPVRRTGAWGNASQETFCSMPTECGPMAHLSFYAVVAILDLYHGTVHHC